MPRGWVSKEAPIVGAGNPNRNTLGQLDLIYDPRNGTDVSGQYGNPDPAGELPGVALR